MKIKDFKNGASVIQDDPSTPSGMILVYVRNPQGEIHDKIRCENRTMAREYFNAFCAIAKNMKG